MTTGDKAKRAPVAIGPLSVDGFQMLGGSYRRSQTSADDAVGLGRQNVSNFLRLKAIKSLLGEGCTSQIFKAEPDALREQVARQDQQLHEAGLEPWQLPQNER
ncbi:MULTISPECIES: hypothetical protein [Cyanophyceae]|uniref:Uncharacterized protein n=1 Tax=Leptolyngbya subtilissima DQ-A4 TaxID=2933933 RepID=A0ABV0KE16_9CYAN|nr:hypothetical protein [Nodosilinea sp. FACHB-141]MBD2114918.1 hypothetical protein [Nodosilinea sp. FACHB-141]